ncbi:hypothetical protein L6164_003995 [Bauhinia variegata]|uniref:Uncharacterized protein n=1 Tax=Bauhinia variegata TaxID=167791 RepID=A0ACB9Q5R3_BAUVA|nr:hypothetical protein L6164_003995 [Bauhinia variegata]
MASNVDQINQFLPNHLRTSQINLHFHLYSSSANQQLSLREEDFRTKFQNWIESGSTPGGSELLLQGPESGSDQNARELKRASDYPGEELERKEKKRRKMERSAEEKKALNNAGKLVNSKKESLNRKHVHVISDEALEEEEEE